CDAQNSLSHGRCEDYFRSPTQFEALTATIPNGGLRPPGRGTPPDPWRQNRFWRSANGPPAAKQSPPTKNRDASQGGHLQSQGAIWFRGLGVWPEQCRYNEE